MAEFKWHLMEVDTPEEGERDYIVMGHKGGLQLAKGYRVPTWCVGTWFYCTKGDKGRKRIEAEDVYAWAEIPPLEVSDRCAR